MATNDLLRQLDSNLGHLDKALARGDKLEIRTQVQRVVGLRDILGGNLELSEFQRRRLCATAAEIDKLGDDSLTDSANDLGELAEMFRR